MTVSAVIDRPFPATRPLSEEAGMLSVLAMQVPRPRNCRVPGCGLETYWPGEPGDAYADTGFFEGLCLFHVAMLLDPNPQTGVEIDA